MGDAPRARYKGPQGSVRKADCSDPLKTLWYSRSKSRESSKSRRQHSGIPCCFRGGRGMQKGLRKDKMPSKTK